MGCAARRVTTAFGAVWAALILVAITAMSAHAQIAGAIGKPLPSPDLPVGTISVRVVAGSVASPVGNTEVTLIVNGEPRLARTDTAGRVQFKDLPVGATVRAKVAAEDEKPAESDEFAVPSDSGARVMLSTKPFVPIGGASAAGGAMPEPRKMSGEPRPEASDPPGTITVRLTYDDFKDAAPKDIPVTLVGYTAQEQVEIRVARTDAEGRAMFANLDRAGTVAYYAMAQLPRNRAHDRMISAPIVLDGRSGSRVVLSAAKRASTEAPLDGFVRFETQDRAVPTGRVRVTLDGVPDAAAEVQLVAIGVKPGADSAVPERRQLGTARPTREAPDPANIQVNPRFESKPDVPARQVNIQLHGGAGVNEPIVGASVRLVPAKPAPGTPPSSAFAKTPSDGYVELTSAFDGPVVAEVIINGKAITSQPFDVSKTGGYLDVAAQWEAQGKLVADFDASAVKPDEAVYAESQMRGTLYRSIPFQPLAAAGLGTRVTLYVYPRVLFSFSLTSRVDDEFLAVNGRFIVSNNSWAPYTGGPDGLIIPLPNRHKGAIVAEKDQADVSVATGEGFRIGKPIPPGGKQFHAGFSLPVEAGRVDWALDLPLGTFQSGMEILETPGMHVQLPASVAGESVAAAKGRFFVIPSISILPKQSMVMTITGLPSPPAWRIWAPRVAGIVVVVMILGGIGVAVRSTRAKRHSVDSQSQRRAALLDELVELERAGQDPKRRNQITAELEALWNDAS